VRDRYTLVAIILHWVMAAGIIALFVMGLVMVHGGLEPSRLFALYQLHKSIGITVLLAAFLRLAWRLTHRPPPLPEAMPEREKKAAHVGHWLLYGFLFGLPLTGWGLVSSSVYGIPTVLFGVVPWPDLPVFSNVADKAPVEGVMKIVHAYGAYVLMAVVGVHVLAALRHHFWVRDSVLRRMLPWYRRSSL